jgi:hypothetical protein
VGGWERNLLYLAAHQDPRARERLRRILTDISVVEDSMPNDLDPETLEEWWARERSRFRWNPMTDCYALSD